MSLIKLERDPRGVVLAILNRPEVHNAFDEALIAELTQTFNTLGADPSVRVIVLAAEGKSFCAGADLNWMRRAAAKSADENKADAVALGAMLKAIYDCPKPTIARVQGNAFGGGVGVVAACDFAVGHSEAVFSLSEVRLGLIPGVISPYVTQAIGPRQSRRFAVSAERFNAAEAYRVGLLHDISTSEDGIDEIVSRWIEAVLLNGPDAMRESKALIDAVMNRPIDDTVVADTVARISRVRSSSEGREGVAAFLEKRKPSWIAAAT